MATQQRDGIRDTGALAGASDIVIAYEEPGFAFGKWKNISVVVWGTQGTIPLAKRLEILSNEFIAENPRGISSIHIVVNAAQLPDAVTRSELNRLTDKYAKNLACMATVIEGSGFWASAMQSFITSLHWVTRRPFKVRLSSTIPDATSWIPTPHWERTGVRVSSADLLRNVMTIRERVK